MEKTLSRNDFNTLEKNLYEETPKLWMAMFKHVNVYNKPMQFGDKYRFLVPLYENLPENFVCEKAVQCGA